MSVTQHPSVCFLPNFGPNQAIDVALQSKIIRKLLGLQKKNCFIPIPWQITSLVRPTDKRTDACSQPSCILGDSGDF